MTKHNCIQYRLTDSISIWEIETEKTFDYYVQANGTNLFFSFGSSKENKQPRFNENDLMNLLDNGYFDSELEKEEQL